MYPHLKVQMSVGGWSGSRYFSDAALTPASRQAFVASCIDLFIKGNLPIIGTSPHGRPGSGAGVFDGIDLDWEWPASECNVGNVVRPEDKQNLTAVLAEFRRHPDEYGSTTGQHYSLTAFLPADPAKISAGIEVANVFGYLDFATVQGYDLHGAWESTTNHQAQLFSPAGDPSPGRYSVDLAVQTCLAGGAPAGKLVIGIPYYGRGWTSVANVDNGLYEPASGPARARTKTAWTTTRSSFLSGRRFYDAGAGVYWLFDGRTFWSYDDPHVLSQKTAYVKANGLGGTMGLAAGWRRHVGNAHHRDRQRPALRDVTAAG